MAAGAGVAKRVTFGVRNDRQESDQDEQERQVRKLRLHREVERFKVLPEIKKVTFFEEKKTFAAVDLPFSFGGNCSIDLRCAISHIK